MMIPTTRIETGGEEGGLGVGDESSIDESPLGRSGIGESLRRPNSLYQDSPIYQELILYFQRAEWKMCLENINTLLAQYPEDVHLASLASDVEFRLAVEMKEQQISDRDKSEARQRLLARVLSIVLWVALVTVLFLVFQKAYQVYIANLKVNQEAALLDQTLTTLLNDGDIYLESGRPEEALRLYYEIQRLDPDFMQLDERIARARRLLEIETAYQQAYEAFESGDINLAAGLLEDIQRIAPGYKNVDILVGKIETQRKIDRLLNEMQDQFAEGNWEGVIDAHEQLKKLAPFTQVDEIDQILFISYRNLIIEIAGDVDASLDDIEAAERYYRAALALFPQDKKYALERDELQRVAVDLLANKYYLYGVGLLKSSNYSVEGVQEAIRILNKAENIGSGSPVIRDEIGKAQLFLESYNLFLGQSWDAAIDGLEQLRRKDEEYADGMLKYLLYEAYLARGDSLLAYSEFDGALLDYQDAEKYAWANEDNKMRLFQVQVRIAYVLSRQWRYAEAAEFYRYAFGLIEYRKRLTTTESQDLLDILDNAMTAFNNGDPITATRYYQKALEEEKKLYTYELVRVWHGDSLAQVAYFHNSTVGALLQSNRLGNNLVIENDQEILVPVLP